jgi:hypothetical protein
MLAIALAIKLSLLTANINANFTLLNHRYTTLVKECIQLKVINEEILLVEKKC